MNLRKLLNHLTQNTTAFKAVITILVMIWTIVFVMLVGSIIFAMESSTEAQPSTPVLSNPSIMLSPATGSAGSSVSVEGQDWPASSQVLIYLFGTDTPSYAVASASVDPDGRFSTSFIVPADPTLSSQDQIRVLAQAQEGSLSAQATLTMVDLPAPPTATATATIEPDPTSTEMPTPTPVPPTDTPAPALGTANVNLNIRSGPGLDYPVIAVLSQGQSAEITGVSPDYGWWQIGLPAAEDARGWVSAPYVTAQNSGNVPVVYPSSAPPTSTPAPTATSTPQPTATPVVITDWRGEYYNNISLSGSPTLVRNDISINFNWGAGSPAAGLPANNFSARWTRRVDFDRGTYRLYARADDGIRVYLDGDRILNEWHRGDADDVYQIEAFLDGRHRLEVIYYEATGDAEIEIWWERVTNTPTPTRTQTPTPTPTATPISDEQQALQAAISHLVGLTNLPTSEIQLVSQQAVTWNDSRLGCGPDDVIGAPVLTPGYLIILEARGQAYEYHTDRNGRVVLCQSTPTPTPTATVTSTATPTETATPTATPETPTVTPTATPSPTETPLPTVTLAQPTAVPVPSSTPTAAATATSPITPTPTVTTTAGITVTATAVLKIPPGLSEE